MASLFGDGSIWSDLSGGLIEISGVLKLLDSTDGSLTVENLLLEDTIIQDTQAQSDKLLDFLTHEDALETLLSYVAQPHDTADENRAYRFPYMACEVIACGVPRLLDAIVDQDRHHLRSLFARVLGEPPRPLTTGAPASAGILPGVDFPSYMAGYWSKVMKLLASHRPAQVARFLDRTPGVAAALVSKHLHHGSIAGIVATLVTHLPFHGGGGPAPDAASGDAATGSGFGIVRGALSRGDDASVTALLVNRLAAAAARAGDRLLASGGSGGSGAASSGGASASQRDADRATATVASHAAEVIGAVVVHARHACPHPKFAVDDYTALYLGRSNHSHASASGGAGGSGAVGGSDGSDDTRRGGGGGDDDTDASGSSLASGVALEAVLTAASVGAGKDSTGKRDAAAAAGGAGAEASAAAAAAAVAAAALSSPYAPQPSFNAQLDAIYFASRTCDGDPPMLRLLKRVRDGGRDTNALVEAAAAAAGVLEAAHTAHASGGGGSGGGLPAGTTLSDVHALVEPSLRALHSVVASCAVSFDQQALMGFGQGSVTVHARGQAARVLSGAHKSLSSSSSSAGAAAGSGDAAAALQLGPCPAVLRLLVPLVPSLVKAMRAVNGEALATTKAALEARETAIADASGLSSPSTPAASPHHPASSSSSSPSLAAAGGGGGSGSGSTPPGVAPVPSTPAAPVLGSAGLTLLRLLCSLTACAWPEVTAAVVSSHLLDAVLDCMVAFAWHSIAHRVIADTILALLRDPLTDCNVHHPLARTTVVVVVPGGAASSSGSTASAVPPAVQTARECYEALWRALFFDARLLNRVIAGCKLNALPTTLAEVYGSGPLAAAGAGIGGAAAATASPVRVTRVGYAGHLISIANAVVSGHARGIFNPVATSDASGATSGSGSSVPTLLASHGDWWRFVDRELLVANVKHAVLIGGMAPDVKKSGNVGTASDASGGGKGGGSVDEVAAMDAKKEAGGKAAASSGNLSDEEDEDDDRAAGRRQRPAAADAHVASVTSTSAGGATSTSRTQTFVNSDDEDDEEEEEERERRRLAAAREKERRLYGAAADEYASGQGVGNKKRASDAGGLGDDDDDSSDDGAGEWAGSDDEDDHPRGRRQHHDDGDGDWETAFPAGGNGASSVAASAGSAATVATGDDGFAAFGAPAAHHDDDFAAFGSVGSSVTGAPAATPSCAPSAAVADFDAFGSASAGSHTAANGDAFAAFGGTGASSGAAADHDDFGFCAPSTGQPVAPVAAAHAAVDDDGFGFGPSIVVPNAAAPGEHQPDAAPQGFAQLDEDEDDDEEEASAGVDGDDDSGSRSKGASAAARAAATGASSSWVADDAFGFEAPAPAASDKDHHADVADAFDVGSTPSSTVDAPVAASPLAAPSVDTSDAAEAAPAHYKEHAPPALAAAGDGIDAGMASLSVGSGGEPLVSSSDAAADDDGADAPAVADVPARETTAAGEQSGPASSFLGVPYHAHASPAEMDAWDKALGAGTPAAAATATAVVPAVAGSAAAGGAATSAPVDAPASTASQLDGGAASASDVPAAVTTLPPQGAVEAGGWGDDDAFVTSSQLPHALEQQAEAAAAAGAAPTSFAAFMATSGGGAASGDDDGFSFGATTPSPAGATGDGVAVAATPTLHDWGLPAGSAASAAHSVVVTSPLGDAAAANGVAEPDDGFGFGAPAAAATTVADDGFGFGDAVATTPVAAAVGTPVEFAGAFEAPPAGADDAFGFTPASGVAATDDEWGLPAAQVPAPGAPAPAGGFDDFGIM